MHRKSTGRICRAIFENSYLATTKTGCTHFLPTPTPKTLQFAVHKFFGVCNPCFHPPFHFRCELCPVSFLSAELLSVPSLTSMVNWMISAGVIALKGDCKHTFINTHTQAGHWFGLCTRGIYQLESCATTRQIYFNRPVYTQKSNTEYPLKIKFCSTFRKVGVLSVFSHRPQAAKLAVCRFRNRRLRYGRIRFVSRQEHLFPHSLFWHFISSFPFHFVLCQNNLKII